MCELTCEGYKKLGLTACEGCAGKEERKPIEGVSIERRK